MAVLDPRYWHMSIEELNELCRVEWKNTLAETEKKTEEKMRAIANSLIDIVLLNHKKGKLNNVK